MAALEEEKTKHYNDWPNAIGFTTIREERTPVELTITGKIPAYVHGTLYRIGPGGHELATERGSTVRMQHWFDGFSQLHRFHLTPDKITYTSRHLCDTLLTTIRRTGRYPDNFTFGQPRDPCKSLFRKFASMFTPPPDLSKRADAPADDVNVNVTLTPSFPGLPAGLYAKTDANILQRVNADTLEPEGIAYQHTLHPDLTGPLSAAHARRDPETGDVYNYNLTIARTATYRIFHVSAATGATRILATIPRAPACYIHSFFLTAHTVVLCLFSARYTYGGVSIPFHRNILASIAPDAPPALWYVIDRARGGVLRELRGDALFAFHTINAWETGEWGGGAGDWEIVADVVGYADAGCLRRFLYAHVRSDAAEAAAWAGGTRSAVRRYVLGVREVRRVAETVPVVRGVRAAPELPVINPRFVGRRNRFSYHIVDTGRSTLYDAIVKFDHDQPDGEQVAWWEEGCTPGEPLFIPDPEREGEEDGVLVSVVLDGRGHGDFGEVGSFLVFLDPRDLSVLAKVGMGGRVVGHGFHGAWVGQGANET